EGRSRLIKGQVDVEKLLDDAAESVRKNPPEVPGAEAEFREILGLSYKQIGSRSKEKDQLERSMALREQIFPDPSPELAAGLHVVGIAAFDERNFDKAFDLYSRELAMRRKLKKGDDKDIAMCLTHLAQAELRRQHLDQAEKFYIEALDMRRRMYGPDHPDVAA